MFGLGAEELLVIGLLGLLMFKPAEIANGLRKLRLWKVTLESWAKGMWEGWKP